VHQEKENHSLSACALRVGLRRIPFDSQRTFPITYRNVTLKHTYTPDFICYAKIIVEIKAAKSLADEHRAQVLNYLKITHLKVGLLVNFGSWGRLEWERLVL
jgi:GxxExxY protein